MKIFIDANILISVLNHEFPLFSYTSKILSLADSSKFQIFTSPICLAISFYFVEKKSGREIAKKKMDVLISKIQITIVNQEIVNKAINNPKILDFEDGLEYYSAVESKCELIITEDLGDFYFSEIPILNSQDFVRQFFSKKD